MDTVKYYRNTLESLRSIQIARGVRVNHVPTPLSPEQIRLTNRNFHALLSEITNHSNNLTKQVEIISEMYAGILLMISVMGLHTHWQSVMDYMVSCYEQEPDNKLGLNQEQLKKLRDILDADS